MRELTKHLSHFNQDPGISVVFLSFLKIFQVISQDSWHLRTPGEGLSDGVYLLNEKHLIICLWIEKEGVMPFVYLPMGLGLGFPTSTVLMSGAVCALEEV